MMRNNYKTKICDCFSVILVKCGQFLSVVLGNLLFSSSFIFSCLHSHYFKLIGAHTCAQYYSLTYLVLTWIIIMISHIVTTHNHCILNQGQKGVDKCLLNICSPALSFMWEVTTVTWATRNVCNSSTLSNLKGSFPFSFRILSSNGNGVRFILLLVRLGSAFVINDKEQ